MRIEKIQFLAILLLMQFFVSFSQNELPRDKGKNFTTELSFGPVQDFSTGEGAFMAVDSISSEKMVFVYRDWENSGFGTAVIGTINDMEMTFSNPCVFASGNIYLPKVKTVNDSVFLVIYRDMNQSGKGFIVKGIIENENIVFDSPLLFCEAMISTTSIILMNDADFIIAYKDNGNNGYGTLKPGSLINGIVELNDNIVFNEATSFENVLTCFNDSTFIITYRDMGNNERGTVKIGTISNGSIDLSEPFIFSGLAAIDISVEALSSSTFIVSYKSAGNTGVAILGHLEGGQVTFSGFSPFSGTANVSGTSVVALSDSLAVISYSDEGNNGAGNSIVANIINDTILFDEPVVFNNAGSFTTYGIRISDSTFVLAFRNEGNSFFGSAVIGKVIVDQTTDIHFYSASNSIRVFPNPTNGILAIEGNKVIKIDILNIEGQTIESLKTSTKKQ
ncbi:MAG: hypothetical protein R2764_14625 [Bacteroidales bacterium]